ncbi:unnamed protein product [Closterium sp. NIES-65]|nr:unnamed protein product [Closterium sp. NIES-65]
MRVSLARFSPARLPSGVARALLGAAWVAGWAGLCAWVVWFAHSQAANPRQEAMRAWCRTRVRYLQQDMRSSIARSQRGVALMRAGNAHRSVRAGKPFPVGEVVTIFAAVPSLPTHLSPISSHPSLTHLFPPISHPSLPTHLSPISSHPSLTHLFPPISHPSLPTHLSPISSPPISHPSLPHPSLTHLFPPISHPSLPHPSLTHLFPPISHPSLPTHLSPISSHPSLTHLFPPISHPSLPTYLSPISSHPSLTHLFPPISHPSLPTHLSPISSHPSLTHLFPPISHPSLPTHLHLFPPISSRPSPSLPTHLSPISSHPSLPTHLHLFPPISSRPSPSLPTHLSPISSHPSPPTHLPPISSHPSLPTHLHLFPPISSHPSPSLPTHLHLFPPISSHPSLPTFHLPSFHHPSFHHPSFHHPSFHHPSFHLPSFHHPLNPIGLTPQESVGWVTVFGHFGPRSSSNLSYFPPPSFRLPLSASLFPPPSFRLPLSASLFPPPSFRFPLSASLFPPPSFRLPLSASLFLPPSFRLPLFISPVPSPAPLCSSHLTPQESVGRVTVFGHFGPRSSSNLSYWGLAGCVNNNSIMSYSLKADRIANYSTGTVIMLLSDQDRPLVESITGFPIQSVLGLPAPRKDLYGVNVCGSINPDLPLQPFTDFTPLVPPLATGHWWRASQAFRSVLVVPIFRHPLPANASSQQIRDDLSIAWGVFVVPIFRHPLPANASSQQIRDALSIAWGGVFHLEWRTREIMQMLENGSSSTYSFAMYDNTETGELKQFYGPDKPHLESRSVFPFVLPVPVAPPDHVEPFPEDMLGSTYEAHCGYVVPYP